MCPFVCETVGKTLPYKNMVCNLFNILRVRQIILKSARTHIHVHTLWNALIFYLKIQDTDTNGKQKKWRVVSSFNRQSARSIFILSPVLILFHCRRHVSTKLSNKRIERKHYIRYIRNASTIQMEYCAKPFTNRTKCIRWLSDATVRKTTLGYKLFTEQLISIRISMPSLL